MKKIYYEKTTRYIMKKINIEKVVGNALFKGMDKRNVEDMIKCIRPKLVSVRKNDYVAFAGNSFDGLGILLSGQAVVSRENAAGKRIIMTNLNAGDIFGEMIVFSSLATWPVSVQAITDCTAMFLSKEKIVKTCGKACKWHYDMILNLMSIISDKALTLNKKLDYISIKSMRVKISTYLLELYKKTGSTSFIMPLNRNELADFLNVSRPSMSREMGRMRDEGIIDFHRSAVKILDLEALKEIILEE